MDTKWRHDNTTNAPFNASHNVVQNSPGVSVAGLTTAYVFLLVLSLVGNTLILVIIYKDRRLRTNVNFFIANMAASDLLFPTFAIPFRISSLLTGAKWIVHGIIGEVLCKLVAFAGDISSMVSVLCLVAIAVDRFDAVVFPMTSQLITKKVRTIILISTWLASAAFLSPYFYAMQLRAGRNNSTECLFTWGDDPKTTFAARRTYIFVNFAFFIALPLLLFIIMYSIIIFSLVRQSLSLELSTRERKQRMKENRQIALMSLVVMVIFIITYTPLNVYLFIHFLKPTDFIFNYLFLHVSHLLSIVYSAVNPLVYYIFHEKYREGFHKIFKVCHSLIGQRKKFTKNNQQDRSTIKQTVELTELIK